MKYRTDSWGLAVPTRVPLGIWRYLDGIAVRRELASLGAALPPRPDDCALEKLRVGRAIWRLAYGQRQHAYVSLDRGASDEERYVVLIDAERFYRAWLSSSLVSSVSARDCFAKIRRRMPRDYKYEDAEKGFRVGRKSPVPLPTLTAWPDPKGPQIAFSNGVTRTYWLLHNRVGVFPAEVYGQEAAQLLYELVGIGFGPTCCNDIFEGRFAPLWAPEAN